MAFPDLTRIHSTRRDRDMGLKRKTLQSSSEHTNMSDLRIVLLGKNLSTNTRVRNSILGIDVMESEASSEYLQNHSVRISGMVENRHIALINSTHLLQPNLSQHQILERVKECISVSAPGPHAIILVLQLHDFTETDTNRVKYVLNCFGDQAMKRTILLTADEEKHNSKQRITEFISQLIKECGGGHLQFDTRQPECRCKFVRRVDEVLEKESEEFIIFDMYEDAVEETSVDKKQSWPERLPREDHDSDHEQKGKLKGSHQIRGGVLSHFSSVAVTGKSKLNLVLCGTDARLKATISKLLRGKMKNPLNQREFSSVCLKKEEKIHGRLINVVELPALTQLSDENVMLETFHCLYLCDPGVHVFLFIPIWPLTKEDKAELEKIQKIFGSKDHFMMIFTTEPTVEVSVTDYFKTRAESLIGLCRGQHKVLGLKEHGKSKQIPELLDYIENMKTEPYSLQMYVRARENEARHETEKKYEEKLRIKNNKIKELQEKILSEGAEGEADDQNCLRIVLIGRTGNGKSATGNTILGNKQFQSNLCSDSVTTVCEKGIVEVDGRSIAVVDTPGLFDTTLSNKQVMEEIVKCVSMSAPGPHAFIIVLSLGRFIQVESDTIDLIKKIFGPKAAKFSIVLFTGGDNLEDESIDDYVKKIKSNELKKLIRDCENRFLVFNNREKDETQKKTQVTQLLKMMEKMKKMNQGQYFTNSMFEEAEMSIKKKTEEILKEKEREIQTQNEELKAKYEIEKANMMKRLEEEKRKAEEERMQMEKTFRENEETIRKEFEEKERREQQKREKEKQKQLEEEKKQRAEYHQKIEQIQRENEDQRSLYELQQREREEEDRKREEKYRQDQEKMKHEQEEIIAELQKKQNEEIKKRDTDEQKRSEQEEREREEWTRKIKEAENDRKEIQEDVKRQQREWEEKVKQQMTEREEDERKRKKRHDEQLNKKQEELEKMTKKFEKEIEEERQQVEYEKQKQREEREAKEREYKEKKNEMNKHYEKLERERKEEWNRRKQEDDERREEEKKQWEKMIEDLKQEQVKEIKRRETQEKERKECEKTEREEIKQKHEEELKQMKKIHVDEARKKAEEFNVFKENKEQQIQELKRMLEEHKKPQLPEEFYTLFKDESEKVQKLKKLLEEKNTSSCVIL